jgi:putative effector of murein hydrolase
MFEHRHQKLLPRKKFLVRVAKYGLLSIGLIIVSLIIGMLGYHMFEGLSWIDAFLNSAMLMGGMGPVSPLYTDAGKIFAGFYSLYCGMVLLIAVAIFAAPIFHRFFHHFHLESER